MSWTNGEEFTSSRGSHDSGSLSLGLFLKIFLSITTGLMIFIFTKVINQGERVSTIETDIKYIVKAVEGIDRKLDSIPTARR